jgi:hypothetical protein
MPCRHQQAQLRADQDGHKELFRILDQTSKEVVGSALHHDFSTIFQYASLRTTFPSLNS